MGGVDRWYTRAQMQAHGGVDGGRRHDGVLTDDIQGMTVGEEAIDRRALGADREPIGQSVTLFRQPRRSRSEECFEVVKCGSLDVRPGGTHEPALYTQPTANSGDSSAPSRTAATPPAPKRPAASSTAPPGYSLQLLYYSLLECPWRRTMLTMLDGTADSPQRQGLFDSAFPLLSGFRHQRNTADGMQRNILHAYSMAGNLPHISERYSEELRELFRQMLSRDPKDRPSAEEILAKPFLTDAVDRNSRMPEALLQSFMKSISAFDKAYNKHYKDIAVLVSEWGRITDSMESAHYSATAGSLSGSVIGAAGGITALVGLILAPFTLGASLIVTGVGVGVGVAGGVTDGTETSQRNILHVYHLIPEGSGGNIGDISAVSG
ncbi:unnamed protein product [Leuciscus chuanchicus]